MYLFNVYNNEFRTKYSIQSWKHHHPQGYKQIHHLQNFSLIPSIILCVIRTIHISSIFLENFKYKIKAIGATQYGRSPELILHNWNFIHFEHHLPMPSSSQPLANLHSILWFYEFDYSLETVFEHPNSNKCVHHNNNDN